MNTNGETSFKVYLWSNDLEEPEIRRFRLPAPCQYGFLRLRILDIFPSLNGKIFNVYWKDEDEDDVVVASEDELQIALTSMKNEVKKLYIKVTPPRPENNVVHPNIHCDGCETNIAGYRYKCLACEDFDLCSRCEHAGVHPEHPMIRLSEPVIPRLNLRKLCVYLQSILPASVESKHHRRHHSHSEKKKKRCGSGVESGEESEEGCHKKHSHKKWKKSSKCPYSQLVGDAIKYFSPVNFAGKEGCEWTQKQSKEQEKEPTHILYLKNLAETFQKLFDPLGVDVELEVRPKPEQKQPEKKDEEAKGKTVPTTPTAPPQNSVGEDQDTWKKEVDDIAKALSNQSVSGKESSPDEDGWEIFKPSAVPLGEEAKIPEESRETNTAGPSKSTPGGNHPGSSQNIYPNLDENSEVKDTLVKLLEMGFSSDPNALLKLIQQNRGNVNEILEILLSQKKK